MDHRLIQISKIKWVYAKTTLSSPNGGMLWTILSGISLPVRMTEFCEIALRQFSERILLLSSLFFLAQWYRPRSWLLRRRLVLSCGPCNFSLSVYFSPLLVIIMTVRLVM
jgi:hypothetical protein